MKPALRPRYLLVLIRWTSRIVHRIFPSENALLLALAFLVGIGSGLGAVAFEWLIDFFRYAFETGAGVLGLDDERRGLRDLVILVGGGLLGGLILKLTRSAGGAHGVPRVMASVAVRGGRIRPRVAAETAVSAGVCIGAGGSAGPEGPIVQIGSAIGSAVGQAIHMSTERLRILAACGAAGGISAIFGAPLAGVMFAVEVVLGDFGVRSLTAIVLSSVLAAVTHQGFSSFERRFEVPPHGMISFTEIPLVLVLGVLAGFASWVFIRVLYRTEDGFAALRMPRWLKPALGMVAVGLIALRFPEVLGGGYDSINDALNARLAWQVMGALVALKLAATCLTVGSGNVGGLFAPSMVIGAMMGGAFGVGAELLFPTQSGTVALFALVGMAALIAGTTHAVIASILLIFEVTNDYAIVLPVMLASATSVVLASYLKRESIYSLKLVREGIRLRRGVEVNVMSSIRVREIMREPEPTVPVDLGFHAVLDLLQTHTDNAFPVVDEAGRLAGVIAYRDLRTVLGEGRTAEMNRLVVAGDVATADPEVITPEATLNDAMKLYGLRDLSMLPVVESRETMRLVGKLYRSDVLNAYRRALITGQRS